MKSLQNGIKGQSFIIRMNEKKVEKMPNKHQIQQDFYTKMSEWKENYKVNTETQNEENKKEKAEALKCAKDCMAR